MRRFRNGAAWSEPDDLPPTLEARDHESAGSRAPHSRDEVARPPARAPVLGASRAAASASAPASSDRSSPAQVRSRRQPRRQRRLGRVVGRVGELVDELERVRVEVVELDLAGRVLDVRVARSCGSRCRRRRGVPVVVAGRYCSIRSSRPRQPVGVLGERQQRASVHGATPGSAPAASRIVGARSALIASSSTLTPFGIPGPRIRSGTRIASS